MCRKCFFESALTEIMESQIGKDWKEIGTANSAGEPEPHIYGNQLQLQERGEADTLGKMITLPSQEWEFMRRTLEALRESHSKIIQENKVLKTELHNTNERVKKLEAEGSRGSAANAGFSALQRKQ